LRGRPADDVGALDVFVAVGAFQVDVEAVNRSGFGDVEHLPLGKTFDDVEHHDVAQLAQGAKLRQYATNLPTADQRNFRSRHCLSP
jgi:hypothetical protein